MASGSEKRRRETQVLLRLNDEEALDLDIRRGKMTRQEFIRWVLKR